MENISGDNRGNGILCPYCQSKFATSEEMSKHVDRMHHGSGLLEGDSRRW
jgi:uncharacterized C2H2 Zn-finger protein